MEVIECGLSACEEKESLWYAHLCATAASIDVERAHTGVAHRYFDDTIRIREKLLAPNDTELADVYSSFANMLLTERLTPNAPHYAIKLYEKAIKIDVQQPVGYTYLCPLYSQHQLGLCVWMPKIL